jgi:hypothetical protein
VEKEKEEVTNTTRTAAKRTNYELMFFGIMVLAWIVLAVAFNVARREVPDDKSPIATNKATVAP